MQDHKKAIRSLMITKRDLLTKEYVLAAEESAAKKLQSREIFKQAKTVMLYMDFRNEVPTGKLISCVVSCGKKLVLPLTDKQFQIIPYEITPQNGDISNCLKISSFGIREPDPDICRIVDPYNIDLVIVPGVAFDVMGNRMGYGKGCYDHFLTKLRSDANKVALAYEFQVIQQIPTDPYDIKMDEILTVSHII